MKLFKIIIPITGLLLVVIATIWISTSRLVTRLNPDSINNEKLNQIHFLLSTSLINPVQFTYDLSNRQISFFIVENPSQPIKVILSTDKNLYQQVSSFQKLLKIVKMNHQQVRIIDLSLNHPYATFENN